MCKKVLVLSDRRNGDHYLDTLSDEFIRGAQESGHERAGKIYLSDWGQCINHCTHFVCISVDNHTCGAQWKKLYDMIAEADIVVITSSSHRFSQHAEKVYRCILEFQKTHGKLRNKTAYLIVSTPMIPFTYLVPNDAILDRFREYIGSFENIQEGGHLFVLAPSVSDTIKKEQAMQRAYEMGKGTEKERPPILRGVRKFFGQFFATNGGTQGSRG
ncbi:MAG: hypothetical protein FWC43_01325 [Planctomycetaceae bacterium]|nr:hypothetical protein [Planctomycetaceae bacterium]